MVGAAAPNCASVFRIVGVTAPCVGVCFEIASRRAKIFIDEDVGPR